MDSFCSQGGDQDLDSVSSPSSSCISSNSISSSQSDFMDDATTTAMESSSSLDQFSGNGPLFEMSSLIEQLPFKRGLSRYFHGKSQSFTSLSKVRSLEDLVKPENSYNKKLKSCRSYRGLSETSKIISKKTSRGSCFPSNLRRNKSFLGNNRPSISPQST